MAARGQRAIIHNCRSHIEHFGYANLVMKIVSRIKESRMNDELSEPLRMELFAASLRSDYTDAKAFLEALAVKLEGSLPQHTTVTRQSGIFSREHPVKEIAVSLGDYQYRIGRERQ